MHANVEAIIADDGLNAAPPLPIDEYALHHQAIGEEVIVFNLARRLPVSWRHALYNHLHENCFDGRRRLQVVPTGNLPNAARSIHFSAIGNHP